MIGETLSHYRILEKIGQGGMGEVYLAENVRLDLKVALKFLSPELGTDRSALARFQREARAVAALSHPNIGRIYDLEEEKGRVFLVLEYLEGETLHQRIRRGPFDTEETIRIAHGLASGLAAAHRAGIVHRDIKSANVMLTKSRETKILDFGLAQSAENTQITRTGAFLGTLAYMSPEQVQGLPADCRTDLYALGVVIYEMLSGRLPFQGEQQAAVLQGILNEPPPDLASLREGIPAGLCSLVGHLMAKDPDQRPASAEQVARELRQMYPGSTSDLPDSVVRRSPGMWRSRRWVGLSLATALALIGLVLWLVPRKPPAPGNSASDGRRSIAVMYLENLPDPADSLRDAEILANLIVTGLTEQPDLSVMSTQHLHDILRVRGEADPKAINRETALQIAREADLDVVVTGALLRLSPTIDLTTQIVDVPTGRIAASQQIQGGEGQDVFEVAQALLDEILADLGIGPRGTTKAAASLREITSTSAIAYRHYLEGIDHRNAYRHELARKSFERAVEADSSFVMAYYFLSASKKHPENLAVVQAALRHAGAATRLERGLMESVRDWLTDHGERALGRLDGLGSAYPDQKEIFRFAARIKQEQRDPEGAISDLERVLELDPIDPEALGLLPYLYYYDRDDPEEGLVAAQRYMDAWPGLPDPYDVMGDLLQAEGDCEGANRAFLQAIEVDPDWMVQPYIEVGCYFAFQRDYQRATEYFQKSLQWADDRSRLELRLRQIAILVHQGRMRQALQRLDTLQKLEGMDDYDLRAVAQIHYERSNILAEIQAWDEADATWQTLDSIGARSYYRNHHVAYLARRGDFDAAREELALLEQESPPAYAQVARCQLELYAGNTVLALEASEPLLSIPPYGIFAHFWRARAELAAGRFEDAVSRFESSISVCSPLGQFGILNAILSFQSHYYLAVALDRAGERERAVAAYQEFVDMGKSADEELGVVGIARERLVALEADR